MSEMPYRKTPSPRERVAADLDITQKHKKMGKGDPIYQMKRKVAIMRAAMKKIKAQSNCQWRVMMLADRALRETDGLTTETP